MTVRLASVAINGDVGCIHGIAISSEAIADQCKKIFLIYIPVFELGEMSDKRDAALNPGKGAYIRFS